jgi:uncharacterized protein YjlB
MRLINHQYQFEQYQLSGCPRFPGNTLPVLHYKNVLSQGFLWVFKTKQLLSKHKWHRSHVQGLLTYSHYHSNAHEALVVLKGNTRMQLGGDTGITVSIGTGDVLVIPAGTVHKNLGDEYAVKCLSAYHNGTEPDINCGHPCERPVADRTIEKVLLPQADPIFGTNGPLTAEWSRLALAHNLYEKMHMLN